MSNFRKELESLARYYAEDYPGETLSPQLLDKVEEFCKDKPEPEISAGESGRVCLNWKNEKIKYLTVVISNDNIWWAIEVDEKTRDHGYGTPPEKYLSYL